MWPPKLKPDTSSPKRSNLRGTALLLLSCVFSAACGPAPEAHQSGGPLLRIRVAPLHDYAFLDREARGQPDTFKPEPERLALYADLAARPADLLILRGLGHADTLNRLREGLALEGTDYPHALYLPGPDRYRGSGFFSRVPFEETLDLGQHSFRIRGHIHQPFAGAVRIGNIWIWNAQAPSPAMDYEQRRQEARLLSQALRAQLAEGREVLLSLHSREDPGSPMLRMIQETGLRELPAADDRANRWTFRDPYRIDYRRDQWLFASADLAESLGTVHIADTPALRTAGPFRHQEFSLPLSKAPEEDPLLY